MPEQNAAIRLDRVNDAIAVLHLNRPAKLNALSDGMVDEFGRVLERISSDPKLRVLIVTGAGRGFCAGFDLSLADAPPGEDQLGETAAWMTRQEAFAAMVTRLRALRQPVIAAVNGPAMGAGLGLALAADIRIASSSAQFSVAFTRVGMSGCDVGVSWLLPRCVGMSRAFELMLTARTFDATEAERIGLVSEMVEDDNLLPRATELAESIVANSAFGVWMTKRGAWANLETGSLQAAIELENRSQMVVRTTGDLSRAAKALLSRSRTGRPSGT